MTKNKIRINICFPLYNYQIERGELEVMVYHKWVLQVVPAMTTYKPPSLQTLLHKVVLFHNHQKVHGKNVLVVS